jgi:hypothetical protein
MPVPYLIRTGKLNNFNHATITGMGTGYLLINVDKIYEPVLALGKRHSKPPG